MRPFRFPPPGGGSRLPPRVRISTVGGVAAEISAEIGKTLLEERALNAVIRTRRSRELAGDLVEVLEEFRSGLNIGDVEAAVATGDARVILNAAAPNQIEAELGATIGQSLEEAVGEGVEVGLRFGPSSIRGVPVSLATEAAVASLGNSAGLAALGVNQTTQSGIREILRLGLTDGLDSVQVAQRIGNLTGLSARDVRAVENFRIKLTRQFVPTSRAITDQVQRTIDEEVEKYRGRLLRNRGRTIAETEIQTAIIQGEREFWNEVQRSGSEFGDGDGPAPGPIFKTWQTVRDNRVCPICEPLQGATVPLDDPFSSSVGPLQGPPAHPRCRCFLQYGETGPDGKVRRREDAGPERLEDQEAERFLDADKVDEDLRIATARDGRYRRRLADMPEGSRAAGRLGSTIASNAQTIASLQARGARARAGVAGAKSTEEAFKLSSGAWAPERLALHDQIFADLEKGASRATGQPIMQLTGGGSASGKGTLLGQGKIVNPSKGVLIDSDDIKARIPEFQEMVDRGDSTAAAFVHRESSIVGDQAIGRAVERRYNMTLDGTGDGGIEKLRRRILPQKEAGYLIKADYVYLPTDEAVRRSALRAARTGRKVPELSIRSTHRGVSQVVPEALDENLFDEFRLWDNGETNDLIARKIGDGDLEILKPDTWAEFLAKANEDIEKVL